MDAFKNLSEKHLKKMRDAATEMFGDSPEFIIGVNGSIARREATSGSDVDLFFLSLNGKPALLEPLQLQFRNKLIELGLKLPATDGVFETPHSTANTLHTIGGDDDRNEIITRRMLILLEGEWIYNESAFSEFRKELIGRYINGVTEDSKICLFLLNDIIRYWRTICVDFEHKTEDGLKPRAIRIIKLRFSRMLLYFAGVLAVAETHGKNYQKKKAELERLLALPPIERIQDVLEKTFDPVRALYFEFLVSLDTADIRKELELPGKTGEDTKEFKDLSEKAREFKDKLTTLLIDHYGMDHPVVKALLF